MRAAAAAGELPPAGASRPQSRWDRRALETEKHGPAAIEVGERGQTSAEVNGNSATCWAKTGATLLDLEIPQVPNETVTVGGAVGEEIQYLSTA